MNTHLQSLALKAGDIMMANNVPNVKPRFDFPGSQYLVTGLNVILGICVLGMAVIFFLGLAKLIAGLGKDKDRGSGAAILMIIGAVIGAAIFFTGAAFLNGWIDVFASTSPPAPPTGPEE